MEIPIKPEFETMIRERLEGGEYETAASVVEAGLRLLATQDADKRKLEELSDRIQVGLDQLAQGEYTEFDSGADLVRDMERRGLVRLSQRSGQGTTASATDYSGDFGGRSLADLMEDIGFVDGGPEDMSENKAKYLKNFGSNHE